MDRSIYFITGTDTGVGKTTLACWLARYLLDTGASAPGLKPVSSGNLDDARHLRAAGGNALPLTQINPWHFRAPLSPLLAACREKQKLKLQEVADYLRRMQRRYPTLIVEGAGGLLSPLGDGFNSRDLIVASRAVPVVVCPNRLGAINQSLLVLAALPRQQSHLAQIALMSFHRPDTVSRGNIRYLSECLGPDRIHAFPRLENPAPASRALADPRLRKAIRRLIESLGIPVPRSLKRAG